MDENELKFSPTILPVAVEFPVYLVEFSNANVKFQKEMSMKFQSYKCSLNTCAKPKKILVASNNVLQYAGSNYEGTVSDITSSLLKVGVYNKNTHKFKIYDVDFFRLKPLLKCQFNLTATEESLNISNKDLCLTFGTKNRKRTIKSAMEFESLSSSSMQSVISSQISRNSLEAIVEESKLESEIIPSQNKEAKSVEEIYNVYDNSEAKIFYSVSHEDLQQWESETKFCNFIIHYLKTKFHSISPHVAKLLQYLHYMIIMLKTTYKDLRKKDPFPNIPQPYKKSLTDRYLVNRAMPQKQKDKLLAHAMVLALILNNYHIDGKIWTSSTHIPMTRVVLVAYLLGCHVHNKRNEGTKSIELKLPLYKYEPKGKKRY
ncbi:UNVERIFIED_CONTAM: polr1e [Trichonephila clavipes]